MEELEQVNIVETLAHAKKVLDVHREWLKKKSGPGSSAVDMIEEIEASFETLPSSIALPKATSTPIGPAASFSRNHTPQESNGGGWNGEIEEEIALDQPKEKRSMLMDDSASSNNNFPSAGRKRKKRRSKASIVPVTMSPTSSSTSLKLDPSPVISNAWERDSEMESQQQPFEPNVIKRELRLHETLAHIKGDDNVEEEAMLTASKQPSKHRLPVRSATIINAQESTNSLSSKEQHSALHSKSSPQLDRKKSLTTSTTSITPISSSTADISLPTVYKRGSAAMPTLSEPLVVKPASIKRKLSRNNKVQPIHVVEPVKPVLPVKMDHRMVWQQPVNGDIILEDAEDWIPPEDMIQLKPDKETSSVGSKEVANGDMKVSDVVSGVEVARKPIKMASSDSVTTSDVGGLVTGKQDNGNSIYNHSPFSPRSNRNGNFKITDEDLDMVPLPVPPLKQPSSRKANLPTSSLTSTTPRDDGDNGDGNTSSAKGNNGDNGDGSKSGANSDSVKDPESSLSSKAADSSLNVGIGKPQTRQLLPPLVKGNEHEDERQEDNGSDSEEERLKDNQSDDGKDTNEEIEAPRKPPPLRVKSTSSIYTPDFKFQKKRDRVPPVYSIHARSSTLPPACPLYGTTQPTPNEVLDRTVLSRSVLPSTQPSSASSQSKATPTSIVNEDSVSSDECIDYSRHSIAMPTNAVITGPSELHLAARDGNIRKVQMLLNEGYKVDELDNESRTPLMYCILPNGNAQLHCVDLLLRKGANIDHQSSEGFTALHLASYCGIVSLMELLIMSGANPDIKDVDERLPLHWSTRPVSTKPIELLLKHSVNDVHAVDKTDMTLLMWACYNCNATMAKYLLERGADPEEKDTEGKTAMHWACSQCDIHCLQLLLTPDMTYFKDQKGCTVMHTAAQHGFILGVQYILKKRSEAVYDTDKEGRTPLHYAAASDRVDVCYLLLNKGADATHKDNHGLTALEYAKKTCNEYVVALFTCHRASMADFTRRERTLRNESRRSTTKSHDVFDDIESSITQESLRSHDCDNISIATTISSSRFQDDMDCIKEASVGGYLGLFNYEDYKNVTEKELRDPPCHYYFWLDDKILCWSRSKDKPNSRNNSGCSKVSRVEEGPSTLVKSRPDYSPQDLHQFAFRVWLEGRGQPLDLLAYTNDFYYMWIVGLNALVSQHHGDDDNTSTVSVSTDGTKYNQTTEQGGHDVEENQVFHKTSTGQKNGLELM